MTATALRIAVREARASRGKFLFVIVAVALGVGCLTGVRGFSQSFKSMLLREARSVMAGDVSVRIFGDTTDAQEAAIRSLAQRKARTTRVTETLSMVSSTGVPDPVLVTLKAVDPKVFPFYGNLVLTPDKPLRETLDATTVVLSEDARIRLRASVGDTVKVGGQDFRVAAVIAVEPDRMSGSFNVGPRVLISRDGLDRAGLLRLGSRASNRLLLRLDPGAPDVAIVNAELKKAFPEALINDFRETNPNLARGLDRATTFLSLVSLIALIVGAIGVSTAMHAHLQQKMDTIATLKSLGARSGQVVRIYLIQTALLGLAGGLVGVVVGMIVQRIFPELIERYFQMRPDTWFTPSSAVQGLLVGLLTTLLFTLPPLLGIRKVKPALIFRRDMAEVRQPWRHRLADARMPILAAFAICLGLAAIAGWLIDGTWQDASRVGAYFIGGLVVSFSLLYGVAALLLKVLHLVVRSVPMPMTMRHALANLYRPGSQSRAVLTALGVGVMFTLTVYLIQRSVLAEIRRSAPPGMANVFFIDITPEQRHGLVDLLSRSAGVEGTPDLLATVSARITAINGTPVEQVNFTGFGRRYRMARAMAAHSDLPPGMTVLNGTFWKANPAEPQISLTQSAARALKLEPGGTISWNAYGKMFTTRVAAIHRTDERRLNGMVEFVTTPGILEGLPTVYYASARVKAPNIAALQRDSYAAFPTVTVINIADLLDRVQEVVDQIALVIRFLSAFAILAGAIILSSSVAGTRFRRIREIVIFKTLGATRATVAKMFSIEFLVLGFVAGAMGSILATVFSRLLLKRFFDAPFQFDPVPNVIAVVATALIAAGSGWLASFRLLGQKPLEILRGE
jgi:putative ABC transport system permease protein